MPNGDVDAENAQAETSLVRRAAALGRHERAIGLDGDAPLRGRQRVERHGHLPDVAVR